MSKADPEYYLPVGVQEFYEFADRIITKSGEFADCDSMIFAIATMVLHADPTKSSYPDSYFVDRLRKSAANQVASQIFQDIKAKQLAAQEAAKQASEATAAPLTVEATTESEAANGQKRVRKAKKDLVQKT